MSYEDHDIYGRFNIYPNRGSATGTRQEPDSALLGAETLIGNNVYNQSGEKLGDIKEIMLDTRSGRVSYAVLSSGGFLGMGEKLFAVPWSALKLDSENKCFVLNVEKERLKNAPGFNKGA